jgi:predicted alpha/beta superfamily hydrolase
MQPTLIDVVYPIAGGRIGLRGSPPLSWQHSVLPRSSDGLTHRFELVAPPGTLLEIKPIRDERDWARGRNQYIVSGEPAVLEPHFEREQGVLEPKARTLFSKELGRWIRFRIFLPPSYGESSSRRYPTLYVQDGQSQFNADSVDGHSWELDHALDELYSLDVIQEVIVIAVYTDAHRLDLLGPTPDAIDKGGHGRLYLDFLVETLKPFVDSHFPTRPEAASTSMLGSSMGGLFSFYAAWTRSDVFGRAACLSGSFWWADESMVREVQKGVCPVPRPWLYIDSGVALNMFERDANLRDGFHHTVGLRDALVSHCYTLGANLHVLVFAGMRHDTASWAARLAIPLQLLLPREPPGAGQRIEGAR